MGKHNGIQLWDLEGKQNSREDGVGANVVRLQFWARTSGLYQREK